MRSLVIDGKVDASNMGDMLTQRLLGLLPVLLHADPQEICIIGLGSGVTVGSALAPGVGPARRRGRDFARSRERLGILRARKWTRPRHARRPPHRRRWPVPSTPFGAPLRRDRFRAVESVDGRHRGAVHARVLRSGARTIEAGRPDLPMGAYLRHQSRRSAIDRADVRIGFPRVDHVARWRGGSAADRIQRGRDRIASGRASSRAGSWGARRPCSTTWRLPDARRRLPCFRCSPAVQPR